MKGKILYFTILGICLVLVFLSEYMSPHEFRWRPTFDQKDKEPFGCYVFDDVLSSSVEHYQVVNKTFYQAEQDSLEGTRSFLIADRNLKFNETDLEYMYKLLYKGNKIMLCAEFFPDILKDSLQFKMRRKYLSSIQDYIQNRKERDSLFFGTNSLNPEYIYKTYPQMHRSFFIIKNDTEQHDTIQINKNQQYRKELNCDSAKTLVWDKEQNPLAIQLFIGKGELFLVSTPLMFTNYGMLDKNNASYAFRLLSFMKDKPLFRIEAYGENTRKSATPLRYILSEKALRHALYTGLILLLLFMFFTAKRRQRIIPVLTSPANRALTFMKLISNLYYQKHDNGEMIKIKYTYFCSEVKHLTGIELYDKNPDENTYSRLAERTAIEAAELRTLIKNIRLSVFSSEASDKQLKEYIDGMNDILQILKY